MELAFPTSEATAETHHLWAMDLDDSGNPVRAHLIVNIERRHRKTQPDPDETRTTACGMKLTGKNHPEGWWYVPISELPIAVQLCHCGVGL